MCHCIEGSKYCKQAWRPVCILWVQYFRFDVNNRFRNRSRVTMIVPLSYAGWHAGLVRGHVNEMKITDRHLLHLLLCVFCLSRISLNWMIQVKIEVEPPNLHRTHPRLSSGRWSLQTDLNRCHLSAPKRSSSRSFNAGLKSPQIPYQQFFSIVLSFQKKYYLFQAIALFLRKCRFHRVLFPRVLFPPLGGQCRCMKNMFAVMG